MSVLLPSATVFLLLLCNDKAVLGPCTNPGWLNAIASLIVGALVVLSAVLTATTLFPHVTELATRDPATGGVPWDRHAQRGAPLSERARTNPGRGSL